jgi:hypothetical protein
LQIKQRVRRKQDASQLETRMEGLCVKKRSEQLCHKVAQERARLYSLAYCHFPELLAAGSEWASTVGVSVDSIACGAWFTGLYEGPGLRRRRVYKAMDESGHSLALKEFDLRDEREMRHFFRQVVLIRKTSHANVVHVRAVFREEQHFFILQMPWYGAVTWPNGFRGIDKFISASKSFLVSVHGA